MGMLGTVMSPPHIEPDIALAAFLFAKLEQMSLDPPGITRDSYGLGEERAHGLIRQTGNELGLLVNSDPAGNTLACCRFSRQALKLV